MSQSYDELYHELRALAAAAIRVDEVDQIAQVNGISSYIAADAFKRLVVLAGAVLTPGQQAKIRRELRKRARKNA